MSKGILLSETMYITPEGEKTYLAYEADVFESRFDTPQEAKNFYDEKYNMEGIPIMVELEGVEETRIIGWSYLETGKQSDDDPSKLYNQLTQIELHAAMPTKQTILYPLLMKEDLSYEKPIEEKET